MDKTPCMSDDRFFATQGGYLDSMREAALSIYQEYLSDKVGSTCILEPVA